MDTTRLANFMDRAAGFGEQPVLKKPYGMPFESFVCVNELLASDPDVAAVFSGVEAVVKSWKSGVPLDYLVTSHG